MNDDKTFEKKNQSNLMNSEKNYVGYINKRVLKSGQLNINHPFK